MSKITEFANGQKCQISIDGVCCGDEETVVFAHLNGGGMGMKREDLFGAFACYSCHAAVDGHIKTQFKRHQLKHLHLEGVVRTQKILLDAGLIQLPEKSKKLPVISKILPRRV